MHDPEPGGEDRLLGLALSEPAAVGLDAKGARRSWSGVGLVSPDGTGLAVHARQHIVTWGDPRTADLLRQRLADAPAVTLGDVQLEAAPAPARGAHALAVLRRPHMDLVVRRHAPVPV